MLRRLVVVLVTVLLVAGCSSPDDVDEPVAREDATTTTAATDESCDQGATTEAVEAAPVEDVPSDLDVTSFDGTDDPGPLVPDAARGRAGADDPHGPGLGRSRATRRTRARRLFGALGIGPHERARATTSSPGTRGASASRPATATVNDPEHEGRDVQVLLDWVAEQPEAQLDGEGDPRSGMVGGSYGGGIQLTVAGIDCRVDALVPNIAWHSLETSLYKATRR